MLLSLPTVNYILKLDPNIIFCKFTIYKLPIFQLRVAADRAKVATASAGKFQDKIKGEKPNVKKGIKRKVIVVLI